MQKNKLYLLILLIFYSFILSAQKIEEGKISYYADKLHGRKTASGEIYDKNKLTGAHRTLPFNTIVRVTNLENNRSVIVRINDRGPFVGDRIIDISKSAAEIIDIIGKGVANGKIEILSSEVADESITKKEEKLDNSKPTNKDVESEENETNNSKYKEEKRVNITDFKSGLFFVNMERVQYSGFGIQVANYEKVENFFAEVNNIERRWNKKSMVYYFSQNNTTVLKLIIGTFATYQEAQNYLINNPNKKGDEFIVDLSKLLK